MINPTSGNRLLTPPFSLSFLYTIQESGPSGRTARFPFAFFVYRQIFIEKQ